MVHFICFLNKTRREICDSHIRITNEALTSNMFSSIKCFSEDDFDLEWKQRNESFIKNNTRGYGYWIWKPQIILQVLKTLEEDEVLVYADCGCEIQYSPRIHDYKEILKTKDMIAFSCISLGFTDRKFCKKDLLDFLNHTEDTFHLEATSIIIKKNNRTIRFLERWVELCEVNNHHFVDDSPSVSPNFQEFIEHRHDQSIFSLLVKKEQNVCVLYSELYNKQVFPIHGARNHAQYKE